MRAGDISNEVAPAVGIRFERVIRTEEGKLNRAAKAWIQAIIGELDCNVYIITTADERKARSFLYKWNVPYTRVIEAVSTLEIPDITRENELLTYHDIDLDILQNVRARGAKQTEAKQWTVVEIS